MIRVCAVDDLPVGEAVRVAAPVGVGAPAGGSQADGVPPIAVFNVDGEYFAIDDTCTHQDASLADGYLEEDCTVECPLHASCFDLRTGEPTGPPAKVAVRTHAVVVDDGVIFVTAGGGSGG